MKIIFLLSFDSILLSRDLLSDTLILVDNLSLLPGYFYAILFVLGILQFESWISIYFYLAQHSLSFWVCGFHKIWKILTLWIVFYNETLPLNYVSFPFSVFLLEFPPISICGTFLWWLFLLHPPSYPPIYFLRHFYLCMVHSG